MDPLYQVDGLDVYVCSDNQWKQNAYLLMDTKSHSCIAIDPGYGSDGLFGPIKAREARVECVMATHTHFDHIAGVAAFKNEFGASFICHKDELPILRQANVYTMFLKSGKIEIPEPANYMAENVPVPFGQDHINIWHVPGHTPGGCLIMVRNLMFSGDTLLKDTGKLHRLPGSDLTQLQDSRRRIFKVLSPETIVFPGHGRMTSLAVLRPSLEAGA
jgi:hydroxyacylglutathione hydrolase